VRALFGFGVLNLINVVFAVASASQVMLHISLRLTLAAFTTLPNDLDLTDVLITADALCRARHKASYEDVTVMPMCWPGLLLVAATWALRSA